MSETVGVKEARPHPASSVFVRGWAIRAFIRRRIERTERPWQRCRSRGRFSVTYDPGSFLGLGGPRAGLSAIRATSWVRSPNATAEQLEDLCQYVQDTSPFRDILASPVPVTTDLIVLD